MKQFLSNELIAIMLLTSLLVMWVIRAELRDNSLDLRLDQVENTRFTANQGMEIWKALGERALRSEVPPPWFKEQVDDLKARLTKIEQTLEQRR